MPHPSCPAPRRRGPEQPPIHPFLHISHFQESLLRSYRAIGVRFGRVPTRDGCLRAPVLFGLSHLACAQCPGASLVKNYRAKSRPPSLLAMPPSHTPHRSPPSHPNRDTRNLMGKAEYTNSNAIELPAECACSHLATHIQVRACALQAGALRAAHSPNNVRHQISI